MLGPILFLYFIGLILSIFGASLSDVGGLLVVVIVSVPVLIVLYRTPKQYTNTLYGAYFFRVLLLIWDRFFSFIYQLPNSGADSGMFHRAAASLAMGGGGTRGGLYSQFLSTLYKLYGPCQILGQYLNLLLSIWMILILIKCFQKLDLHYSVTAIKLVSFLPNFAIMNVILLRETPIMFVLSLSLYAFIIWYKDNNFFAIIAAFALTLLAAAFHGGSVAPAGGYALFIIFYSRKERKMEFKFSTVFLAIIFVAGFLFLYTSYGDTLFSKISGADIEKMVAGQLESEGGSGYSVGFNFGNSTLSFILSTPIRMVYFLFSPFPWQWRGLSDIIAFVFSSCFYAQSIISAFKVLGVTEKTDSHRIVVVLLLFMLLSSSIIFGWGVSNVGTAVRHRDKFAAQCVLLFGVADAVLLNKRQSASVSRLNRRYRGV